MQEKMAVHIKIKQWTTVNGTSVLYVHRPEIPMVEINVVLNAGSARDDTQYGLSQLTNMIMSQGTKKYAATRVAEQFAKVGARFYTTSDRDMALIGMLSLSENRYFDAAVNLFSEVIASPVFSKASLERSKKIILSAIKQQASMPDIILRNMFFSQLYKNHPYAHPILGTLESIQTISLRQVEKFYKTYYSTRNALLIIVGSISEAQARAISKRLLYQLAAGQVLSEIPYAAFNKSKDNVFHASSSEQTQFLLGQVAVAHNDKNYFPLLVGAQILGGSSVVSRLFKELREKHGLTYNITCRILSLKARGPLIINFSTNKNDAKKAWILTQHVLEHFLEKGPTHQELKMIKKKIINSFPLTIASNENITQSLLMLGIYKLPLNYITTYCEHINAVTRSAIKEAMSVYLHPAKMLTMIVGPYPI